MEKQLKLDQSRLLGFKIQPRKKGAGFCGIGVKAGKIGKKG